MKNNALFLFIFCCDCATSPTVVFHGPIIYEGPLYGDFIVLFNKVENCMGKRVEWPYLVVTTEPFECFTILAYGCTPKGKIIVDAEKLIETKGALFSHESVHYILALTKGEDAHNNPLFETCGTISLNNFHL